MYIEEMMRIYCLWMWLLATAFATCPIRYSPTVAIGRRKEAIKIQIISKLRLNQELPTNVTRDKLNFHLRWQVDDYYNNEIKKRQADHTQSRYYKDRDSYYSKTVKLFRFPEETILTPNTRHYKFDTLLGSRYMATGAQLKLAISQKENIVNGKRISLRIYKLAISLEDLKSNMADIEQVLHRPIHTTRVKKILSSKDNTYDFDFQMAFDRWSQWPESNHGMLICIGRCFEKNPKITFNDVFLGNQEGNRPLLSIDTYEENHSRKKRSGTDCVNPSQQKKCCRYHYYVKFADLGMNWILAPEGYDAYYCSGECPFMYLSEQTSSMYYTFVLARANYNNPKASPQPCCTPAILSELSIMYSSGKVDSQGQPTDIEIHVLDDMIVQQCGCS